MAHSKHFLARLARALILLGVAAGLAACAARPKPVEATTPFTVTEVRVTTQSMSDFGFADRLQHRLDLTAGRATSDIGLTSILRIVVLDRNAEVAGLGFFSPSTQSATIDLTVIDAGTGQVLKSRLVHASAPARDGRSADTVLIDRLAEEIRALLGLSGAPPHPVAGIKRTVAWPELKPEPLDDAALFAADPLLNGTVTPTSLTVDVRPGTPALDLSRPLLTPEPVEEGEPRVEDAVAPVDAAAVPGTAVAPPETAPAIQPEAAPAAVAADEPCIITLDNDCSDPDSQ